MKTELDKNEKLSTEQEAPPIANVLLALVYFFLTSNFPLHLIISGVKIIVGKSQYTKLGICSGKYFAFTTKNAVNAAIKPPVILCKCPISQ